MTKPLKPDQGSIVLEAALVLPFFLAFVLALIAVIQIVIAENALHSAVAETVKTTAASMYPVKIMNERLRDSGAGQSFADALEKLKAAREKLDAAEQMFTDYANLIPEPVYEMIGLEQSLGDKLKEELTGRIDKVLYSPFVPIVEKFVDSDASGNKMLKTERLSVIRVVFPDLQNGEHPYFGIEAQYDLPLHIPFFHYVVHIRKKAYERVWIGA